MRWFVREYHDEDLESVIRLCDTSLSRQQSVFGLRDCLGALRSRHPALVAIHSDVVIGVAVASVSDDRAWVVQVALHNDWRERELVSSLLAALETHLVERHVRLIGYVHRDDDLLEQGLETAGYERHPVIAYFQKTVSIDSGQAAVLERLGGLLMPANLWESLGGMDSPKNIIERRVIAPLAQPEHAQRHGVVPPQAIVLFGPPGTGKTTFARGIASRLGWPFVEVFPSRLASDPAGLAAALRDTFGELARLERVLVFIDEVEEIAGVRDGRPISPMHGVTNELLKLIPAFRQHDTRLLVCATNSLRSLDPAFLRPGRFDSIIPIGPPDEVARRAIWTRYASEDAVDIERLAQMSKRLTSAEIEYCARAAAQIAFERYLSDATATTTDRTAPRTDDYLEVLSKLQPGVSEDMLNDFLQDAGRFARL